MTSTQTTYLYLICPETDDDKKETHCKVGISHSPANRLRNLQGASPHKLTVYEMWDFEDRQFAIEAEKMAHTALKRYRAYGEWFRVSPREAWEIITLWFYFSAQASAYEKGDDEPIPGVPENGVGWVKNGMADSLGRIVLPYGESP